MHGSDSIELWVWRCRLPLEPASKDLLELFDKLQQNVVCLLEVSACRAKLTGDMQLAQAQLVAQGVSGVTPKGMMTGQVELVSYSLVYTSAFGLSVQMSVITRSLMFGHVGQ